MLPSSLVSSPKPDPHDGEPPSGQRAGFAAQVADALVTRLVDTRLAGALIERVLQALMEAPALEQLVVRLLTRLEDSPAIDALVDRQVGRLLQALENSEALRQLVRQQAGAYLEYLTEHPEPVQQLIQDQSRGMAREFQERVRATALDADDAVESWVRRVLRRS